MTSGKFIKKIAKEYGISERTLHKVLNAVEIGMKQWFVDGDEPLKVCDLTFSIKIVPEHWGRNVYAGIPQRVAPCSKIKDKMSKDWTDLFRLYRDNSDSEK